MLFRRQQPSRRLKFVVTCLTLGILTFVTLASTIDLQYKAQVPDPRMAATHGSIHITSNSQFTAGNGVTGGDGSYGNPYVIENWVIDASGGTGIQIENTNVYVTIQYCSVSYVGWYPHYGIKLVNASGVAIINNSISNKILYAGIRLVSSDNNTIINCTTSDSAGHGILLESSHDNILTNNTASGNNNGGIGLDSSCNNTIKNNTASVNELGYPYNGGGIKLKNGSNNNTLLENTVTANNVGGIYVESSNDNNITYNTASGNGNGGIRLVSAGNNTIACNMAVNNTDGITLDSSSGNLIVNNTALDNREGFSLRTSSANNLTNNLASGNTDAGIYLYSSDNNTFTNNTATKNEVHGIVLGQSSDNTLAKNIATRNGNGFSVEYRSFNNALVNNTVDTNTNYGISVEASNLNTLVNNTASNNTRAGIYLEDRSRDNLIWGNNLVINAHSQVYCNGSEGNQWSYRATGNYYGDYSSQYPTATNDGRVWSIPYHINGSTETDRFPLADPNVGTTIGFDLPVSPTLQVPVNSTSTGNVTLTWTGMGGATSYTVYRATTAITGVNNLTPIASNLIDTTYTDVVGVNGTYYYVVVAHNQAGDSPISNCVGVTVAIPPPVLPPTGGDVADVPGFPLGLVALAGVAGVVVAILREKKRPEIW